MSTNEQLQSVFDTKPFDLEHQMRLGRMLKASDSLVESLGAFLQQMELDFARKMSVVETHQPYHQGRVNAVEEIRRRLQELITRTVDTDL